MHLERNVPLAQLRQVIGDYRAVIKIIAPDLPYTCSTGWKGGYWARGGEIGSSHLDFIEVHHYTHNHGEPWDEKNPLSLWGLEKLNKPILLGEFKADDFAQYVSPCRARGFLGAAPWSLHHDFPISEATWQLIRESRMDASP